MSVPKAVENIKAKAKAPKDSGQWEVKCEWKECPNKTQSSKLHDWKTDGWIRCPEHKLL